MKIKKIAALFFIINVLVAVKTPVYSQKKSEDAPPPPVVKPKTVVKNDEEKSEAAFKSELAKTLIEIENWREFNFSEEGFKVLFPRTPVKRFETFYDEALGNVKLSMHMSVGDRGVYAIGTMKLPYAITDQTLLRQFYQETAKEFLSDEEYKIIETKDITARERFGLEFKAVGRVNADEKSTIRVFLIEQRVFFSLAMSKAENLTTDEDRRAAENEKSNFFDSLDVLPKSPSAAVVAESALPVFKSSFANGVFRSDYFNFTMQIPKGWIEVSQTDVAGMRQRGKDVLKENSNINTASLTTARRNLFTFSAKPLGFDENILIACNLSKRPSPNATLKQLSDVTERQIKTVDFYTVTKSTHRIKLGNNEFVGFEVKGTLAGETFHQSMYFCFSKDYALGFVLVYFNEEQKKILFDSLGSLNFKA